MPATRDAISKLDEQIAMLQKIRDLAANPIAFEAMRQLAVQCDPIGPATYPNGHPEDQETLPTQRRSRKSGLKADILAACRLFREKEFIVKDLVNAMTEAGYVFHAKFVRSAVSSNLQALAEEDQIVLRKRGVGSEPSVYANGDPENMIVGDWSLTQKK